MHACISLPVRVKSVWVRVFLGMSYLGYEFTGVRVAWVRVVLVTSCPNHSVYYVQYVKIQWRNNSFPNIFGTTLSIHPHVYIYIYTQREREIWCTIMNECIRGDVLMTHLMVDLRFWVISRWVVAAKLSKILPSLLAYWWFRIHLYWWLWIH